MQHKHLCKNSPGFYREMLDSEAVFLEVLKVLCVCVCVSVCMPQASRSSNAIFERQVFVDKPALCNLFCTSQISRNFERLSFPDRAEAI